MENLNQDNTQNAESGDVDGYEFDATYSPEDNKLRLYAARRLDAEEYQTIKAAGFKWAPKQELFVAPAWSPAREDILLDLCGYIGDESQSAADRAADRAERFADYRDKRRAEAHGHADTFASGPMVHGYQSQARADRAAARHDRQRLAAVNQWSKAEYWQERTAGVIAHALYLSDARTRRRRIQRLEAEERKTLKAETMKADRHKAWQAIAKNGDAGALLPLDSDGYAIPAEMNAAQRVAYALANDGRFGLTLYHPTCEAANEKAREIWGHGFSAYDFLTKSEFIGAPFDRLSPKQYAVLYLSTVLAPGAPDSVGARWAAHYKMRLDYEKRILEAVGGMSGNQDIEPGGRFGGKLIIQVTKSHASGRVVSVKVKAAPVSGWVYQVKNVPGCDFALATFKVEDYKPDYYSAPTEEDRAALAEVQKAMSAAKKTTNATKPKLINPTREAAQALQDALNRIAYDKRKDKAYAPEYRPTQVVFMTQAEYKARSKGSYARFETSILCRGAILDARNGETVCKLRMGPREAFTSPTGTPGVATITGRSESPAVVVITDKPQKPLPDWRKPEAATPEAVAVATPEPEAATPEAVAVATPEPEAVAVADDMPLFANV